jgi:hypothetical protein
MAAAEAPLLSDVKPDRWGVMLGLFDAYSTLTPDGQRALHRASFLEV